MISMTVNNWVTSGMIYGFSPAVSIAMGALLCLIALTIVGLVVYTDTKGGKR